MLRLLRSKDSHKTWIVRHVILWGELVLKKLNLKWTVLNREILDEIDWTRNIFLISNHQSYADIPAIYVASQKVFGFIAKYELSYIPFLHFWMKRQGCVFINRGNFIAAVRTLRALEKRGQNSLLAAFPEGTRSKNGQLGPFKPGVLKIAWQLDAVILPMIIQGTRQAWEARSSVKREYSACFRFENMLDLKEIKKKYTFKGFLSAFQTHFQLLYEKTDEDKAPVFN